MGQTVLGRLLKRSNTVLIFFLDYITNNKGLQHSDSLLTILLGVKLSYCGLHMNIVTQGVNFEKQILKNKIIRFLTLESNNQSLQKLNKNTCIRAYNLHMYIVYRTGLSCDQGYK